MKSLGLLRLGIRTVLSVVFSLLMYLIGALIRLATLVKPGSFYRPVAKATSFWAQGIALIWGMRIRVSGPRPQEPFFLITNHISYTDIVLLCAVCPAWLVSKREVGSWPLIGALTRMSLAVFIDRETRRDVARMNAQIETLVREGGSLIFFPEGTTSDGNAIETFKPSLLQPAVDLGMPVQVAAITYTTPEGEPPPENLVAWVGDNDFAPHAKRLLAASGFTAHIRFSDEPLLIPDRKLLSTRAREQMIRLHRDLRKDVS